MVNYKPKTVTVSSTSTKSGTFKSQKVTTSAWGLFLLRGSAYYSTMPLSDGCLEVWESNSTGDPEHITFTDAYGRYGVTCTAGKTLIVRFYGK